MKIQNEAYHYLDKTIQQYADRELYGFAHSIIVMTQKEVCFLTKTHFDDNPNIPTPYRLKYLKDINNEILMQAITNVGKYFNTIISKK